MQSMVYVKAVRPSVRLSVHPVIQPLHTAVAGLLLWAQLAGDIECCTAGARQHGTQQQMRVAPCCQLTLEAEHRLP